jgi:hypothetical protein
MRFKERRSSTLSVMSERKVAIDEEKQGHDRAVILLLIDDEFYTVAPFTSSSMVTGAFIQWRNFLEKRL